MLKEELISEWGSGLYAVRLLATPVATELLLEGRLVEFRWLRNATVIHSEVDMQRGELRGERAGQLPEKGIRKRKIVSKSGSWPQGPEVLVPRTRGRVPVYGQLWNCPVANENIKRRRALEDQANS